MNFRGFNFTSKLSSLKFYAVSQLSRFLFELSILWHLFGEYLAMLILITAEFQLRDYFLLQKFLKFKWVLLIYNSDLRLYNVYIEC